MKVEKDQVYKKDNIRRNNEGTWNIYDTVYWRHKRNINHQKNGGTSLDTWKRSAQLHVKQGLCTNFTAIKACLLFMKTEKNSVLDYFKLGRSKETCLSPKYNVIQF